MRTLLFSLVAKGEMPSWAGLFDGDEFIEGKAIVVRFSISHRDIGLGNLLTSLQAIDSDAHRAIYIKRLIIKSLIRQNSQSTEKASNPSRANIIEERGVKPVNSTIQISPIDLTAKDETPKIEHPVAEKSDAFKRRMRLAASAFDMK